MSTMARPKKPNHESIQVGWRIDGKDKHLLDLLDDFASQHRYSRNTVVTIAVEKFLTEWKKQHKQS